jgi:hypothetical protein
VTDTSGVDNLGGWLTTIVARMCLDMLPGVGRSSSSPRSPTRSGFASSAWRDTARWALPLLAGGAALHATVLFRGPGAELAPLL